MTNYVNWSFIYKYRIKILLVTFKIDCHFLAFILVKLSLVKIAKGPVWFLLKHQTKLGPIQRSNF